MSEPIINDIDVSECEFFQEDGGENTCRVEEDYTGTVVCCSACDNCYFKQLKRSQEENENLKQQLEIDKNQINYFIEENEELKERFNELYNNAEQLANKYNKYDGNKKNELVEIINKTTDERNKYKQALEEIKEAIGEKYGLADIIKIRTILDEVLNDRD